ncbi:hypothetical protein ACM614_07260 [Streptomyces sp. 12297]
MADTELTADLIDLQKRSDTAWARFLAVADEAGPRNVDSAWPDAVREEAERWWDEWGRRADRVREAIDAWAEESGQRRIDIETELKKQIRGGKGPQLWPVDE